MESATAIVMETEPIQYTLANVLKNYNNLNPVPEEIQRTELEEMEVSIETNGIIIINYLSEQCIF